MAKKVTSKLPPLSFMFGAFTGSYFHGSYLKKTHAIEMEGYYKELGIIKDEMEYIKENIIKRYKPESNDHSASDFTTLGDVPSHDSADHSSS